MSPLFVTPPAVLPPQAADLPLLPSTVVQSSPSSPASVLGSSRSWVRVVVHPGDTVWGLAQRHGTTAAAVASRNGLGAGRVVRPGDRLWVPARAGGHHSGRHSGRQGGQHAGGTRHHTVRSGETLWGLARRYRTSVARLARANHLDRSGLIVPGTRLVVPGGGHATAAPARTAAKRSAPHGRHTVAAGETLWDIARRHRTTVARLVKSNHLADAGTLRVGQRLAVPGPSHRPSSDTRATFAGRTYSADVVAAAARNRALLASRHVPSRSETRALVVATARRYGVDPRLALAIAWQESGWDQRQVSVANAVGAMQLIPSSGTWASQLVGRHLDLRDARDNVTAGVVILRVLTRSADSTEDAIAGYYQGLASVEANGMYADTRGYVSAVLAHRARM